MGCEHAPVVVFRRREPQLLARGANRLVSTSFQFGGALMLALTTAVNNASAGSDGSPQALLDGFQAAVIVPVIAAALGAVVTALRGGRQVEPAATTEVEEVVEAEAA